MSTKCLQANSIELKDSKGRAVLYMGVRERGEQSYSEIDLIDPRTQTTRLSIALNHTGPYIAAMDEDGITRANLRVLDDGRSAVGVYGKDGRSRVVSLIDMNGDPAIEIRDENDNIVFKQPSR